MTRILTSAIAACVLALAVPVVSSAQSAAPQASDETAQAPPEKQNILQEVIITAARKRAENVQTTPIAVTALSDTMLENAHATDTSGLAALVPNLHITNLAGSSAGLIVYLRGFGARTSDPSIDPHVAIFVDGVYQPQIVGGLFDLFDDTVEVDAGPQGTLLGRNAPVGAIYVTTDKPTGKFGGVIEGEYGSYDHVAARAKVNIPLVQAADGTSILAAKVALVYKEGGNYEYDSTTGKNEFGGENDRLGKLSLLFTPNTDFEWALNAAVDLNRTPQVPTRSVASLGPTPGGPTQAAAPKPAYCAFYPGDVCPPTTFGTDQSNLTTRTRADSVEIASNMSYRFTPVTLTSVTGYSNLWLDLDVDVDGTQFHNLEAIADVTRYDFESQELRLSSNQGGGWDFGGLLDWIVGGYFSNYSYGSGNNLCVSPRAPCPLVHQFERGGTQSEAAFAHAIFHFTDQWSGTFGVRQTWEQKWHAYQPNGFKTYFSDLPTGFHNTSFEAGTQYQFDKDHMAYFRFAQGYESGGYLGLPAGPGKGSYYQPETNNAFEVGFKSDWLNHRLRVNVDLFDNEISNLQLEASVPAPGTAAAFIQTAYNAGSATVQGMEAQITAVPVENLTTHLNLGYLDTKYNKLQTSTCVQPGIQPGTVVDCSGYHFAFAPRWTIDLGADYVYDLPMAYTAKFSADWYYTSSEYKIDPPAQYGLENGIGLVNASVTLFDPSERYSIEFYGTNILDRHYFNSFGANSGLNYYVADAPPAEWGIKVTAKF